LNHCCEIAVCVSTERKAGKARASKTTTAEERAATTTGGGVKRKRAAKVGRRPKTSESEPAAAAAEKNRIKRRKKSASATATTTSVRTGDMGHNDDMGQYGGSYMGLDRVGRKKKKRGRKRKDAAAAVTTSVRAGSDIDVGQIDSKAWKDDNRRHIEDKGPDEVGMKKKRGRKKKEATAEAVVPVDADVIDESIANRARHEELGKAGRRKMKKKKTAIAT